MAAAAHEHPRPAVDELSATALLADATEALRARRLAEVAELELALQWAVLHGHPVDESDPMTSPAGDGAPEMREHAVPELAMARETHAMTTRALLADALDLAHRLPRTWAIVRAGDCEPWVARKVAVISRALLAHEVTIVDAAVSRAITGHSPSTVLEIARAKVIEADPVTHAAERERSRHERYVSLSRADEFGYRCVISRVTAGDAAWVDAMVDRVADILADQLDVEGRPLRLTHNRDELRSLAFGWLARPADLLRLLLEHTVPETDPETRAPVQPAWAPDHMSDTVARLCALPARRLAALRGRGRLFVHVTDAALRSVSGVARIEGVGPIAVSHLAEVLGHADVTVTPVLDLAMRRRADAYEHPEVVKDHVWVQAGGDVFPYSPRTATRAAVDFDHASPYVPPDCGGPPGQTGPHNSGPLRRRHHRWKTHGGYRCMVAGPGRHLWQTPLGQAYLVDHTGTHRLTREQADLISDAPGGVEIYFSDVVLQPAGLRAAGQSVHSVQTPASAWAPH